MQSAPPLALVLAVPWHLAAELRTPGFLEHYVVGEHFKRFLVSGWEGASGGNSHPELRGTIWWFGLLGGLPWLPALAAARRARRGQPAPAGEWRVYLWLWFLAPMLLFSLAGNVMLAYVLPGLPALAVLTALEVRAARAAPGTPPLLRHPARGPLRRVRAAPRGRPHRHPLLSRGRCPGARRSGLRHHDDPWPATWRSSPWRRSAAASSGASSPSPPSS